MLTQLAGRLGLPPAAVVVLLVVLLVQVALQVYGLVDLHRRLLVPGGRKWPWALLIVVGNLVGAVIYLAMGRPAAPIGGDHGAGSAEARKKALDQLYGDRERR